MYKIYTDGTLFCDSSVFNTNIINPKVTLEANTAGSFSFTIPPDHPNYNAIQRRKTVISVVMDGESEPIFQGYCTEESVDFYKQKTIVCEGELAYLNDSILRQHHYQGETVLSLLTAYINLHNQQVDDFKKFEVGTVTVTDSNNSISCFTNYNSTMTEIKEDLVDDLGGYLRVRYADGKKYIDYLSDSPHPATQTIQLGVNLVDYKSNINDTQIATAIIPLGAKGEEVVAGLDSYVTIESVNGGVDYVYSQDAVNTYGWIFNKVEWSDVTTPAALKTKAQAYLADAQFADVTIEARAVDLSMIGEADAWHLLDSIHVISSAHGMDRWFTLTKMEYDLNNPENNTVTLGTVEKNTLTTKTAQTNAVTLKKIEEIPKSAAITNAINSATNKITGASGGHILINMTDDGRPYELLIMDTDSTSTAQKVWRWNENGLGYSSNGYDGTYGLAMTKDGEIVADYITTGNLIAANGKYEINTQTGHIKMADAEITGGSVDVTAQRYDEAKVAVKYGAYDSKLAPNGVVINRTDGDDRSKVELYNGLLAFSTYFPSDGNFHDRMSLMSAFGLNFYDANGKLTGSYPPAPLKWENFTPATGTPNPFQVAKYLNVVSLYGGINNLPSGSTTVNLGTFPYKPRNIWAIIPTYSTASPYLQNGSIWISNTGAMTWYKSSSSTGGYFGGTFVCQD